MNKDLKTWLMALLVFAALFLGGIAVGYYVVKQKTESTPDITITTSVEKAKAPQPARTIPKGYASVPVTNVHHPPGGPILSENKILVFPSKDEKDSTHTSKDTLHAYVPIHQKEYKDSNYTAYVSGYNAKLDSIEIRTKVVTITQTKTKFRTWNIGITGGYGYGFQSKRLEPFIGVGLTLNLFR